MQSSRGSDEPVAKRRRLGDEDGGKQPPTMRQQIYGHITTDGNARAQFGDRHYESYYGPVPEYAASDRCSGPSALRQQTNDHIMTSDNARVQIGDQYYYGPVQQGAAPVIPLKDGEKEYRPRDALKFGGMDTRRATIKLAHGSTCQWLFDNPQYKVWRDDSWSEAHHGFMWIRGKPGAGKSTLMKFAVKNADHEFQDEVKISFFFSAKGAPLERSVEGMYRSLLYQLIVECPDLEKVIHQLVWRQSTWPVELLEECFRDCVLQLGSRGLICHIDALDECEESDVRGMVEFFEGLASLAVSVKVRLRVCFASRHYPHISIAKCVHLILDGLRAHQADIELYVRDNLKVTELAIRHGLAAMIVSRARDVFLWVVLAVRLLNKECDRGRSHSLRAQLDAIPDGVHYLFENAILERGEANEPYLLPILLWVLFSRTALTTVELYHIVLCSSADRVSATVFNDTPSSSQIEKFIVDTSKGLLEVTETYRSDPKVQFIHETVREYLKNGGISRLDSSLCQNPTGLSYNLLKTWCVGYMSLAAHIIRPFEDMLKDGSDCLLGYWDRIDDVAPFLSQAYNGSVEYAELAQAHGVSQIPYLEAFPLRLMLQFNHMFTESARWFERGARNGAYDGYNLSSTTKTYVFADFSATQLLQLELSSLHDGGERRSDASSLARRTAAHSSHQGDWGCPLHVAVKRGDIDNIKLLLEHRFDVNARAGPYHTALETAIRSFSHPMAIPKLLLHYGADVNAQSSEGEGSIILHVAIHLGWEELLRLLVEHGADVNAKGRAHRSVLYYARSCEARGYGWQGMVAYLVEQ